MTLRLNAFRDTKSTGDDVFVRVDGSLLGRNFPLIDQFLNE